MPIVVFFFFFTSKRKKNIEEKKMQRREGAYLPSPAFGFGMKCSSYVLLSTFFHIELFTFFKPCVSCLLEALNYSSLVALLSFGYGVAMEWTGSEVREVGGEEGDAGRRGKFWIREGGWKIHGQGRGCVFGSSSKWLEQPHHELVHLWLLVHSNQSWHGFGMC